MRGKTMKILDVGRAGGKEIEVKGRIRRWKEKNWRGKSLCELEEKMSGRVERGN